jgi:hypothetical protein
VVAIMGKPRHDPIRFGRTLIAGWEDRHEYAALYFDRDEKVFDRAFVRRERTGFLDRVLAWLGL